MLAKRPPSEARKKKRQGQGGPDEDLPKPGRPPSRLRPRAHAKLIVRGGVNCRQNREGKDALQAEPPPQIACGKESEIFLTATTRKKKESAVYEAGKGGSKKKNQKNGGIKSISDKEVSIPKSLVSQRFSKESLQNETHAKNKSWRTEPSEGRVCRGCSSTKLMGSWGLSND